MKSNAKRRVIDYVIASFVTMMVAYFCFLFLVDNSEPAIYHNHPFPVTKTEGNVAVHFELTRATDDIIDLELFWVNQETGQRIPGNAFEGLGGEIGYTSNTANYEIPDLPEGTYTIEFDISSHANWANQVHYTIETQEFEITGK